MVQPTSGFHVYSELNTWIDFMIIINAYEDFSKAEKIIREAEETYWMDEDAYSETIADWISNRLTENDIQFEIFFKEDDEQVLSLDGE